MGSRWNKRVEWMEREEKQIYKKGNKRIKRNSTNRQYTFKI